MTAEDRLEQRLAAVERAVVDGDSAIAELEDAAELAAAVERCESRLEEHERRLADLEGRLDALEGFVGNVDSVNESIERQADAAVAAVDRLEYRIDELERRLEAEPAAFNSADEPNDRTDTDHDEADRPSTAGARTDRHAVASAARTTADPSTGPIGDGGTPERTASAILAPEGNGSTRTDGEAARDESAASDRTDDESSGYLATLRARLS